VCVSKLCVRKLCVRQVAGGGGGGRRECRTKNKNPTQRCGEKSNKIVNSRVFGQENDSRDLGGIGDFFYDFGTAPTKIVKKIANKS